MKILKMLFTFLVTLGLSSMVVPSQAALLDPLTTIELDAPVHFLAPDGSDLVVEAGTYAIEPAEEWIRLIAGERHDALLIEAKKGSHELDIEHAIAVSIPGKSEGQADNHYVLLLLPGGQTLEATGTYSGIRARGFLNQAFTNVKKNTNRAYRQARSTGRKATSQAKRTVQRAKEHVKKSTKQGIAQAKKGVQSVRKGTQRAGKQARTQVRKGTQNARKAALRAKRQVERTARQAADIVASLSAKKTEGQVLHLGDTATVEIHAKLKWNSTKIFVLAGSRYVLETKGSWTDWHETHDANGYPSPNLLLKSSELLRRFPGANWFALICAVHSDKKLLFLIGTDRTMTMPRDGRLTCFANDVEFMYGNNKGSVKLTVTRVDY